MNEKKHYEGEAHGISRSPFHSTNSIMGRTIDDYLSMADRYQAVLAIDNHLDSHGANSAASQAWQRAVGFRSMVYGDGLWHAYGDVYENDEMEALQESFALVGFQDVFELIHAKDAPDIQNEKDREEAVLNLMTDEKLLDFVSRHRSSF